jgi:hypothetical protein
VTDAVLRELRGLTELSRLNLRDCTHRRRLVRPTGRARCPRAGRGRWVSSGPSVRGPRSRAWAGCCACRASRACRACRACRTCCCSACRCGRGSSREPPPPSQAQLGAVRDQPPAAVCGPSTYRHLLSRGVRLPAPTVMCLCPHQKVVRISIARDSNCLEATCDCV